MRCVGVRWYWRRGRSLQRHNGLAELRRVVSGWVPLFYFVHVVFLYISRFVYGMVIILLCFYWWGPAPTCPRQGGCTPFEPRMSNVMIDQTGLLSRHWCLFVENTCCWKRRIRPIRRLDDFDPTSAPSYPRMSNTMIDETGLLSRHWCPFRRKHLLLEETNKTS